MFDFVKIELSIKPEVWLKNPYLNFFGDYCYNTGEVINKTLTAKVNGLVFKIIPLNNGKTICQISGSIHKFSNSEQSNATDFNYTDLQGAITTLVTYYNVKYTDKVIVFEFGLNINPIITPYKALECIKAHKTKGVGFADSKVLKLGIISQFDNYTLKAYDKGRQSKLKSTNLLRIEIKVKRSRYLEQNGLKSKDSDFTVTDLVNIEVLKKLGSLLIAELDALVFIDRDGVNYKAMSNANQKKFLRWLDADYWNTLNKCTRTRQLYLYKKIVSEYGKTDYLNDLKKAVNTKIYELLQCAPYESDKTKKVAFPSYSVCGAVSFDKRKQETPRYCIECSGKIKPNKKNILFCCKECRTKHHYKKRIDKNRLTRNLETEQLLNLLPNLDKAEYQIKYLSKNQKRATRTTTTEIINKPLHYKKYRQIVKVWLVGSGLKLELSTMRAKRIFKELKILNENKTNEKRRGGFKPTANDIQKPCLIQI